MNIILRSTTLADTAALPAIERSAGQRFLHIPELAWIADDQIMPAARHRAFAAAGLSWLAQADEHPVGFLVAEALDSSLFIAELSLHQAWQGKGIGRRLLSYVAGQACAKGYTSLTLTTFRDVPWNAPLYARLGFELLADETLPVLLRQKREEEAAHGLAYESRCAMRLMLT
ncbi:GNAT family N-acetyltransferase [Citrobacter sp. Cu096]|jgi:GNAT superfamily N-acetyltransferase|uniref:GNAT family N-acetyltransferase n=1 Tax=Citrobacter sp. Cu096 TaxID=2985158 RepID=UPI0025771779|nr:GNAT family N-acetyltransferase [Citrobacter sp. Cu096]MDM2739008.1 GNAT family N-acetyltransferase [Citrobacter sp. Cu096]